MKVDLLFHHGGDWIRSPQVVYARKEMHTWRGYDPDHLSFIDLVNEFTGQIGCIGVQQLIVTVPSGKYYEVDGDAGIRTLIDMISESFNVINLYVEEDHEPPVYVPNITHHSESYTNVDHVAGTDCSSNDEGPSDDESESSDYDSEELERLASLRKRQITRKLTDYKHIDAAMCFSSIAEARRVMNLYSLSNGYALEIIKSDKTRLRYKCDVGCPFKCLISKEGNIPGVRIKTLVNEHTCETAYDNPRADSNTIAEYFKEKLQESPKFKVKEMRAELKAEFDLNASHSKCRRAKHLILDKLKGSFRDEYNRLEGYANELRISNPGSDIIINISKDALAEGKMRFLRMYVCFHALKMGFKDGLRPFIGLDGTFLRGKARGQVLVAVAVDAMNQFYPIAWAIVDKERKITWKWFLALLQHSLHLEMGEGFTFISDMQKGLVEAMKEVLPEAKHRFCVKHVESNWMKRWKNDIFKMYLWWAAWSSYHEEFEDQLDKIGNMSKEAADDLVAYPPSQWCRAYFDTVCKNQAVDNNFTESFNSWILEARHKPIIRMLENIRVKVMKLLADHEAYLIKWDTNFSPYAIKLYNSYMKIAQRCFVVSNGDDGFEVTHGNEKHTVDIGEKKCTCRTWDLTGIPCGHAIKALLYKKIDPVSQIHWWYSKEAYALTYKHKLQPVRGDKFWKILPEHAMDPPEFLNMAGRPRTKRKRNKDEAIKRQGEYSASRKGRVMTCTTCGQPGHNSRGCNKHSKGKKAARGKGKRKRGLERKRGLVDEASDDEPPRSPQAAPPPGFDVTEEDLHLSAPQPSQPTQGDGWVFMPTPSVRPMQQPTLFQHQSSSSADPDFEYPDHESDPEPPVRPMTISEQRTRLKELQEKSRTYATRTIKFVGDPTGVSQPRKLKYSPIKLSWMGKAAVTGQQLQKEKMAKLKARKGNGKTQDDLI